MKPILSSLFSFKKIFGAFFIFFLALIIYSNTFHTPFQFDDNGAVVNNHLIRDLRHVGGSMGRNARIVTMYTYALNYHFYKLDVFAYHITNFTIHVITSLLVWWFAYLIFLTPKLKKDSIIQHKETFSFLIALIFISHPVQTQAVTYIAQRFASLATLFYILSLCLYLKGRLASRTINFKIIYFICSGIVALLGMYSKSIVMTLPLMILLIEFIFLERSKRKGIIHQWWGLILLPFFLIVPYIFSFSWSRLFAHMPSESHYGDTITFGKYFLTQFRVAVTFLKLLFIPLGQNLEYDFPLSQSLWDVSTLGSMFIILAFLGFAFYWKKRNILLSFGIFWMALTFSINFIPRVNYIAEHKLYLISVGFCLALCAGLYQSFKDRNKCIITISIIVCIFSFLTFQRNKVWKNELTLWQDIVKKSPNKPRVHLNLGRVYFRYGNVSLAIKEFNKTLELDPLNINAYTSRGVLYYHQKEFNLALKDFNEAIKINPGYAVEAYLNRGNVYGMQKKYDLALSDHNKVLKLKGGYTSGLANRGNTYALMGKYDLAIKDYTSAINNYMEYPEVFRNRGNAYKIQGEYDLAIIDYNKAIELAPQSGINYFHRSLAYHSMGNIQQAMKDAFRAQQRKYPIPQGYLKALHAAQKNK